MQWEYFCENKMKTATTKKLHAYSNVKTNKFEETCLKNKVPTFTEPIYLYNAMFLQDVGDHASLQIFIYQEVKWPDFLGKLMELFPDVFDAAWNSKFTFSQIGCYLKLENIVYHVI